jgi:GNAT superfamily N-acetyltransferase
MPVSHCRGSLAGVRSPLLPGPSMVVLARWPMAGTVPSESMIIESWNESQPRRSELVALVDELQQAAWAWVRFEWHRSNHLLIAQAEGQVVGFLRFVVQDIGSDDEHAPVTHRGQVLTEAKILAFGVKSAFRRQGIGRALQEACLHEAKQLGCYQVRSHSSGEHDENHHLKLAMGFGVHPVIRDGDNQGVYFVMPLRSPSIEH